MDKDEGISRISKKGLNFKESTFGISKGKSCGVLINPQIGSIGSIRSRWSVMEGVRTKREIFSMVWRLTFDVENLQFVTLLKFAF